MGYSPWDCKESDMTEQLSTISVSLDAHQTHESRRCGAC